MGQFFVSRLGPNHRSINNILSSDAVPPIHAVSSHVATDKDPSK